jgi:AcrR family transcriptional regulator
MSSEGGLPGRKGQAARNDEIILTAARDVFLADPKAPIAAVAERAGVGISALYRRYPSKDDMLRRLCHDGLRRYIAEAEAAGEADEWAAFSGFVERIVDADVHSLTVRLAGTFTPTAEMSADAQRANDVGSELFGRAQKAGAVRADAVVGDLVLLLEACSAIRVPDAERTRVLRRRFLAQALRGLRPDGTELPGPPPGAGELNWRWRRDGVR